MITAMGGWTPLQFTEARLPTLAELDTAAPMHAVYLNGRTNTLGKAFFESIVNGEPDPVALLRAGDEQAVIDLIAAAQRTHASA